MNTLRNKVSLIGRLGAKPELVKFENGRMLSHFSIATNESYKNKEGEWVENTQWHNIKMWGKRAEYVAKNLEKGMELALEGRLVNNMYETKSGEKRYSTEIEMSDYLILSSKKDQ